MTTFLLIVIALALLTDLRLGGCLFVAFIIYLLVS